MKKVLAIVEFIIGGLLSAAAILDIPTIIRTFATGSIAYAARSGSGGRNFRLPGILAHPSGAQDLESHGGLVKFIANEDQCQSTNPQHGDSGEHDDQQEVWLLWRELFDFHTR